MHFNDREEIIALTPQWKGERLPDGRPKVEEKYPDIDVELQMGGQPIYYYIVSVE